MNLSNARNGELKEIFDALEEACKWTGTDYYLIGALARDVWYAKQPSIQVRQTKDVDIAIYVGSQLDYDNVRQYLKNHKGYEEKRGNVFALTTPSGVQIDILAFEAIEKDGEVTIQGQGLTSIQVDGFGEINKLGTKEMSLETGQRFRVATLPAIVLLKLLAFDDRPDYRTKDARDIAHILEHYYYLDMDLMYEDTNVDLFVDDNDRPPEQNAAIVMGKEIHKLCNDNLKLKERLKNILIQHIQLKDKSSFVINMVYGNKFDIDENVRLLMFMLSELR